MFDLPHVLWRSKRRRNAVARSRRWDAGRIRKSFSHLPRGLWRIASCSPRKIVDGSTSERIDCELVVGALDMAAQRERPQPGPARAFGSGRAVCQRSLPTAVGPVRHPRRHEPQGQLLAQRAGRIAASHDQERARPSLHPRTPREAARQSPCSSTSKCFITARGGIPRSVTSRQTRFTKPSLEPRRA